jgi:hypothetical protein
MQVLTDGISDEGINALNRLSEEMSSFLNSSKEFSKFALVGSGMQRKVDRVTLGVQVFTLTFLISIYNHCYCLDCYERYSS